MENGTLTMSTKERDRLHYMRLIEQDRLTIAEGAAAMAISERQCYRLLDRYRSQGDAGLIHRLRGRPSNRGYPASQRTRVVALYRERYPDYGPLLFTEKVQTVLTWDISRETIRQWLIAEDLWQRCRRGKRHRRKRPRRDMIGSLIQVDGSHHDWFEGRGPVCCLFVFIDDASNRTFLQFAPEEDTFAALHSLRFYVERHGIPHQVYIDRHAVYWSEHTQTDFARSVNALGAEIIYARSPQAKGRVERANRTHQDRLVKALREAGISDIESANRFLLAGYLDMHNERFAHTAGLEDIHRPVAGRDLNNLICFEQLRTVYHDMTIRVGSTFFQILPTCTLLPVPRQRVTIRRWLDGSLHVFWREQELAIAPCPPHQQRHLPRPVTPPASHPWYHKPVGKAKYTSIAQLCRSTTSPTGTS